MTIKIISEIFENVNKSIFEAAVLVRVKIDNLNEFSKLRKSVNKILLKIKRLRKNKINIKNDILILSEFTFISENIIFVFNITFGFTNLYISIKKALTKI